MYILSFAHPNFVPRLTDFCENTEKDIRIFLSKVKPVLDPHCANEIISTCWKGSNDKFLIAYRSCTVFMSARELY